ncbi:hypothetical protein RclHR1_01450014 [Rhizophagus clarus]|uniref:Uncharacterized protein n=1 Tax=Rhizophagus clarus TaxID=94130 RepID=A0A2Z6R5B6_9GLOM|nr:hypothetical protein RclHR1_01450014 [Rhizophagus clarus]
MDNNSLLILEAQKIATQEIIKGILDISKIAVNLQNLPSLSITSETASSLSEIAPGETTPPRAYKIKFKITKTVKCLYCNEQHWIFYCPYTPQKYKGYCIRCWETRNHLAKHCKSTQKLEPWFNE